MNRVLSGNSASLALAAVALMAWLAACAPTLPPSEVRDQPGQAVLPPAGTLPPTSRGLSPLATAEAEATADRRSVRLTPTPRSLPERVPTGQPSAVVGEVPPELLHAIVDDLVARLDVAATAIEVVRAESVVWPDGSLGCPQPGVSYIQALVPGYWVVLQVGDQEYDYRASERGTFTLCEQGLPLPPGTPGGDTR